MLARLFGDSVIFYTRCTEVGKPGHCAFYAAFWQQVCYDGINLVRESEFFLEREKTDYFLGLRCLNRHIIFLKAMGFIIATPHLLVP